MRMLSGALRVVPVEPEGGPLSALAFGIAALQTKNNLVWFPEGGRSKDGMLQPFRPGIGVLLTNESVPVIPTYIHGTHQALPAGRHWPRLRKISVAFGQPFHTDRKAQDRPRGKTHQTIADAIHKKVEALARNFHP